MSLISLRNAVAPLTNTTHLVTIVLFTVLFGVYRVSGGTIRVSGADNARRFEESIPKQHNDSALPGLIQQPKDIIKTAPAIPAQNPPSKIPDSGSIRLGPSNDGDLLKEMIGDEPLPNARRNDPQNIQPRKPIDKHSEAVGSLDDIEKTLGLK